MIDITGVNLVEFVKKAYELSRPQGMGYLHFTQDPLSDDEANYIISKSQNERFAVDMDYVKGRAVKMGVRRTIVDDSVRLEIRDKWYDHTEEQLLDLLTAVNKLPSKLNND